MSWEEINWDKGNIIPISTEKMAMIRTLASVGITDKVIMDAAEYAQQYAMVSGEGDFRVLIRVALEYALFGGNKGGSH